MKMDSPPIRPYSHRPNTTPLQLFNSHQFQSCVPMKIDPSRKYAPATTTYLSSETADTNYGMKKHSNNGDYSCRHAISAFGSKQQLPYPKTSQFQIIQENGLSSIPPSSERQASPKEALNPFTRSERHQPVARHQVLPKQIQFKHQLPNAQTAWNSSQAQLLYFKLKSKQQVILTMQKQMDSLFGQLQSLRSKYRKVKKQKIQQGRQHSTKQAASRAHSSSAKLEVPFITPLPSKQPEAELTTYKTRLLEKQLTETTRQLHQLEDRYYSSESQRIQLQKIVIQLQNQLHFLKSSLSKMTCMESDQLDNVERLFSENRMLTEQNFNLKKEMDHLKTQQQTSESLHTQDSKHLRSEVEVLRQQIAELTNKNVMQAQQIDKQTLQINLLTYQVRKGQQETEFQKSALATQLDYYKKQLSDFTNNGKGFNSSSSIHGGLSSREVPSPVAAKNHKYRQSNSVFTKMVSCESQEGPATDLGANQTYGKRTRPGSIRLNKTTNSNCRQTDTDISDLVQRFSRLKNN